MSSEFGHDANGSTPLVSIITTVYDRVECLASCVRSVANLSYRNYEHIIVADHPPAEVFAELRALVATADDPRIVLYDLPARTNDFGISPAAFGLRKAAGKYVSFLDDDNVYLRNHFDALISCLENVQDVGFAYSACLFRDDCVLDDPTPAEGKIDLGQVLFRRNLFLVHFDDEFKYSGYAWDWCLIRDLMSRGVLYRFIDQETFIFRLKKYQPFEPEALLVRARQRSNQLAEQITAIQGDLSARQNELAAVRNELTSLQGQAASLREVLVGVQDERDAVKSALCRLEALSAQRQAEISALTAASAEVRSLLAAADLEIFALRTSKSWLLTAPLRAIMDRLQDLARAIAGIHP